MLWGGSPGDRSCTAVLVNHGEEMAKVVYVQLDTVKNITREIKSMAPASMLQRQYQNHPDCRQYLNEYKVSFPLQDADIHNKKMTGAKLRIRVFDFSDNFYEFEYNIEQEEYKLGSDIKYLPKVDLGSGRYTKF